MIGCVFTQVNTAIYVGVSWFIVLDNASASNFWLTVVACFLLIIIHMYADFPEAADPDTVSRRGFPHLPAVERCNRSSLYCFVEHLGADRP